ncbi:MAG TPA: PKD domain-containing protein [Dehalococcoidia bacterium]|nr:PKD domain-containing protein [Dehalococcoidia bacterium]
MIKALKPVCLISILALVLALGAVALLPANIVKAVETLYESYTTGDDTPYTCWGNTWQAQTFTPTSNHNITRAEMLMVRDSDFTGTVTVSIKNTDGSNHPTGTDLTSVSFNASAVPTTAGYVSATFSTPIAVSQATRYALVVRSIRTSTSGQVWWRADGSSPTFSFGNMEQSTDGGSTWSSFSPDFLFRIYGDPDIVLIDADFSGTPTSGPAPLTVQFSDETTGGTVTSWSWDFDNDTTEDSTEEDPEYTYNVPGTYTVSLTVNGGEDTETKTNYITVEASATTVWVDDDWAGLNPGDDADGHIFGHDAFATIQDGIDNVVASTVNVRPGTYYEAVSIDKDLILKATGSAEETIIAYYGDVVTVDLDGETVVIDGFTISEGMAPTSGIHVDYLYDGSSLTIEDCIITQNFGVGIYAWSIEEASTLTIANNTVSNNGCAGIYLPSVYGGSSVTISGNTITGNGFHCEGPEAGIYLGTVDASTVTIDDENTITGNADDGIYNGSMRGGSTYEITGNNNISSNGDDGVHIHVYVDSQATISYNIINENTDDGIYVSEVGHEEDSSDAELIILCNTISENGDDGVDINYQNHDYQVTVSDCNDIFNNSDYGVYNESGYMVDATGNWWGDESGPSGEGPGSGDAVSENVEYEGWLFAPCGEEVVKAAFTLTPPTGQAPLTVQFYDMSTGAETWFWSFGDGSVSEAQYPTHTYQNEGVYSVRLTVEGPGGGTDDDSNQVIVEASAALPELVVRNLYISATQAQPRQQVMITADVFNEGGAWGDGEIQLLINGQYEQSAQVGVAAGTSQPISFTVYKVEAGEYQVVVGNAMGTFYVVEEQQPSQVGGIPMDSGTLIALIVIGVFVIAALIVAIVVFKPS